MICLSGADRHARSRPPTDLHRANEMSISAGTPSRLERRLVLCAVLVAGGAYVFSILHRGWMPFDDGMLGQSAERIIQGQLPHRDFDDVYTGGLAMLDAAAFRLLGTNLWTLRVVLFAVFLAWLPTVFYIASRVERAVTAGVVTLLAVVWSVPNYNAALPSWYNLFFATFGVAALFRYLDVRRARWLFLAGIAGGLSFIVKVVGLYYIAAVLLFIVFEASTRSRDVPDERATQGRGYATFISVSLVLFVCGLVLLVRQQFHSSEVVQFVLPGALLSLFLMRNEWSAAPVASRARFETLARLLAPFLVGCALPIALFLIPYVLTRSLGALAYGVFVLPTSRFKFASFPAPSLTTMLALAPFALVLLIAQRVGRRGGIIIACALAVALLFILSISERNAASYRLVWNAVRNLVPILTLLGVAVLWRARDADAHDPLLRSRTMLLLCATALCSVVQFPFSAANYFCYVAPLVALTALVLHRYLRPSLRAVEGVLVTFLVAFAVLRVNGTPLQSMGVAYQPPFQMEPLRLERGGVVVPTVEARAYEEIVPLLQAHARGGYTWAAPDAPEVYFLSGLSNPTRSLYEHFENPVGYEERTLALLQTHGVTAVVVNRRPFFSAGITVGMYRAIAVRYPHSRIVGPFDVRWRD
jgi:hypothetical protein